ncbi:MAG: MBL fold metallo-hydrolase [Candidatus Babeliales bacterium]
MFKKFKRTFFKKNYIYGGIDPKPIYRLMEICKTFCFTLNKLRKQKLKAYFSEQNLKDWGIYKEPEKKSFEPVITWIGQSTFLIQIGNINILTDPIFSDLMLFYPRNFKPGIELKDLPKIDYILISHNHKDHMEKKSLLYLKSHDPVILVPKGNKKWFEKNNFKKIYEKDWGQIENFDDLKISMLPAIHWAGRSLNSINKSLWGSWMIEFNGFKIYFAGDTAYSGHFTQISEEFKNINIALMPLGPVEPRRLQKYSHIDGHQAIQGFIDLKAEHFVAMHWGTYCLGSDDFYDPINCVKKAWQEKSNLLQNKKLHLIGFGEQLKFHFGSQVEQ